MATIAGASQYLNAATLANTKGLSAQSPSLLGNSASPTGLLDVGRRLSVRGIGLSSSARQLNQQFLNRTADINELLSLTVGPSATVEGMQQQILALRAGTPTSQLARSLLQVETDNGNVNLSDVGQTVDEEA